MDGSLVDLGRDDSKSFTFYRSLSKEAEVKLRCKMRRPDAAVGTRARPDQPSSAESSMTPHVK